MARPSSIFENRSVLTNLSPAFRLYFHIMEEQTLIEKIKRLPPNRVAEVEDFVDSLAQRDVAEPRANLHEALSDYALQHAGSQADLDEALEASSVEHLLQEGPPG